MAVRTVTLTVTRALTPLLQDQSNRAWAADDIDLFVAVRTILGCVYTQPEVRVQITVPTARKLLAAVPSTDLARQIHRLLQEEAEAHAESRGLERRDRPSVRQSRGFLSARPADSVG